MNENGIYRYEPNMYTFPSKSSENNHVVTRNGNEFECSCDWEQRWRLIKKSEQRCGHLKSILKLFQNTQKLVLEVLDKYETEFPNLTDNPHLVVLLVWKEAGITTIDEAFERANNGELIKSSTILRAVRRLKKKNIIEDKNADVRYELADQHKELFSKSNSMPNGQTFLG